MIVFFLSLVMSMIFFILSVLSTTIDHSLKKMFFELDSKYNNSLTNDKLYQELKSSWSELKKYGHKHYEKKEILWEALVDLRSKVLLNMSS